MDTDVRARDAEPQPLSPSDAAEAYGKVPLLFEANAGQTDESVQYISRGVGYNLFLTRDEAVLALRESAPKVEGEKQTAGGRDLVSPPPAYRVLRMRLDGAQAAREVEGLDEQPGKFNYFVGGDPAQWRTNVPVYGKVKFAGVYRGIDLVYYGNQRQLEYDFNVAPGADPRAIRLRFEGAERAQVDGEGDLVLGLAGGEVRMRRPFIYQTAEDGSRREVEGRYVVKGRNAAAFEVGAYDRKRPLVIDPVLSYSTYLGAAGNDIGYGIAVGADGSAYVTGETGSVAFPTAGQTFISPDLFAGQVFVTKLNTAGSSLVYSTLVGGTSTDRGSAVAIDAAGSAYVTGETSSTNFPTVNALRGNSGVIKSANAGGSWASSSAGLGALPVVDVAVAPSNPSIVYAATTGGAGVYKSTDSGATWNSLNTGFSSAAKVAVDPQNSSTLYAAIPENFTGVIKSTDGGATWALARTGLVGGGVNAFAIDPSNTAIVYAATNGGMYKTTNGGANWALFQTGLGFNINGIAIAPTNTAIVYASTEHSGVYKTTNGGANWTQTNTGLTNTSARSVVVDPSDPSVVYAATNGGGVFKTTDGGANWSPANTGLTNLNVNALALDAGSASTVYAGTAKTGIFRTTDGGANWSPVYGGLSGTPVVALSSGPGSTVYAGVNLRAVFTNPDTEAFVFKLSPAGDALGYSTYLGGGGSDEGAGIAVDSAGRAHVAGTTGSTDFPLVNPRQTTFGGSFFDAFAVKLDADGGSLLYSTYIGGSARDTGYGAALDPAGNFYVTGETLSTNFPVTPGAFQTTISNPSTSNLEGDAFVSKLDPSGSSFVYSTYLGGGENQDVGYAVAADAGGNAYVAGMTESGNFPLLNAAQTAYGGSGFTGDAFVTKLNPAGSALVYSTFVGGTRSDFARAVAVAADGSAVVAGATESYDFPVTADTIRHAGFLHRSTDGGATWENNSRGILDTAGVFFDPQTPTKVYAVGTRGIFRSTDEGRTWERWGTPPANTSLQSLAIDPQNTTVLYLTTFGTSGAGIYKSTDSGLTWVPSNGGTSFFSAGQIAVDPVNTNNLYLISRSLFRSTNGGASWSPSNAGMPQFSDVNSVAIDPNNPSTVYASVGNLSRLYKSTNGGGSWSPADTTMPPTPTGGRVRVVPSSPSAVFVMTSGGLYKSVDGGGSWTLSFDSNTVYDVDYDPSNPNVLYIALGFARAGSPAFIYKSTDGGATWQPTGAPPFEFFALAVNTSGTILGTSNPMGGGSLDAFAARLSPSGSSFVYSTFLGGQRTVANVNSANDVAYGVAVDAAGHVYMTGSTRAGDFPTSAETFQAVNRGGDDAFVAKLVMSHAIGGTVTNGATPQAGVRVTLTGDELRAVTTGADGTYSFHNLRPGGSYTVSASKNGFTYAPPSQSFGDLGASQTVNFTAAASAFHAITGRVTEVGGVPVPNVTVRLTGSQIDFTVTNANGEYAFNVPAGGDYTLTPSGLGFLFTPPARSFNALGGNATADFTAARQEIVVTNTNDHGAGSLRQALTDANAIPGTDLIIFNIPGGGVKTISPLAALPVLTGTVVIDAKTQPGYSGSPLVELDGVNSPDSTGLRLSGGQSAVRGLAVFRFATGISMAGDGNAVEGCYLGINAAGAPAGSGGPPSPLGLSVSGSNNRVGGITPGSRNVISGNSSGVRIVGAGNLIRGNFIGTNPAGTAVIQNTFRAVEINTSIEAPPTPNVVGGTEPGARNVISGNGTGVYVSADGAVVQGNYIGTDVTGTLDLGNSTGVQLAARGAVVGGTSPEARNIISGNSTGVIVSGFSADSQNVIHGNYIGTDVTGTKAVGNNNGVEINTQNVTVGGTQPGEGNLISGNERGVYCLNGTATVVGNLIGTDAAGTSGVGNQTGVQVSSNTNRIGGTEAGTANVISGNGWGIQLIGTANVIQGNRIGTDAAGLVPIGNTQGGINVSNANNRIGGDAQGAGNLIAFNQAGVLMQNSIAINNDIRGNSIFSNAGLGIDLTFDRAVTPNDALDADTGPNKLQNFPLLTNVSSAGGTTHVEGSLNSTPNTQFRIDFYSNHACDASGNGEGARPFGSATVTTNASGDANFNVDLAGSLAPGRVVTATATDPTGSTSEFSPCNTAAAQGSITLVEQHYTVLEDVGEVVVRVVRTGGSRGALTVNYATGGGTATAGSDYTHVAGQFTFAEGETEKVVSVPILNDSVDEPEETVLFSLGGTPEIESLGAFPRATIHILDNGTPLSVVPENAPVEGYAFPEGSNGPRNVVIALRLNAATSRTVSVDYAAVAGLAAANSDFVPVSGTVTFAPRTQRVEVSIPIVGDTIDEFNETFAFRLSNPSGATLPLPEVSVNIIDDDAPPTLSVTDVAVTEGAGATAIFAVRLSQPSGKDVSVVYTTADGTATSASDYTATNGGFTYAPGQSVRLVEVPISTDGTAEGAETFFLNINTTNQSRATVADGQGVATIHDSSSTTSLVQFGATSFSVGEADGQATITVTRTGDTSQAAAVDYRTVSGSASDRTDFTAAAGAMRFAAGETQKTFTVLITDDRYQEPAESLELSLSNVSGASLGGPSVVALTITSNDTSDGQSPVREASFDTAFFVRQHYHDFLSREPDAAGLAFWVGNIEDCGADAACREVKRVNVSAAFFLSIEFQETGYLAYRTFKAAYGDSTSPNVPGTVPVIRLHEFLPDSQRIGRDVQVNVGDWEAKLEANKRAYLLEFVQRQRFRDAFPASMTAAEFVDRLNQNAGGVLSQSERDRAVADLAGAPDQAQGRADALRRVAEDAELRAGERNRAMVLMQYYGYLRRNPDDAPDGDFRGWRFWLSKLEEFRGNFVQAEMVKAFISSDEYRQRFGL